MSEIDARGADAASRERRTDADGGSAIDRARRVARRRPTLAFFALTFGYSWSVYGALYALLGPDVLSSTHAAQVPFAWGPPIAAVLVVRANGGNARRWLWRLGDPRANPLWYLAAGVLGFLFADTHSVLAILAGVPVELAQPPAAIATTLVVSLLFAGALEEFGWRGFAQTRLQDRSDALVAAVVVGIAFGLWHAPWLLFGGAGYGGAGPIDVVGLSIFGVLLSVIRAGLLNASGGALPVVMLTHATVNTGQLFEPAGPTPAWLPDTQLGLFVWIAVALGLLLVYGREHLAPRGAGVDVPVGSKARSTEDD